MSEHFTLKIVGHSATLKVNPTGSKDTGIFFPQELIDFLGGMENLEFVVYKEDCIRAMSCILASLPLYSNKGGTKIEHASASDLLSEYMAAMNSFFGTKLTAVYKNFSPSKTTGDRCYLYGLDKGSFSIRKFLIADHSELIFEKDDSGEVHLRVKTEIVDEHAVPLQEADASSELTVPKYSLSERNKILFGAPGTGKSHALEEDCKKYFVNSESDIEKLLIEDIKNTPEKDVEPWFNHLGIKYASFINKVASQETEETLQNRWNIKQNSLWKMKTAAKATIDYNHIVCKTAVDLESRYERVTFHPNYSYAQFVGTYKPVQNPEKGKESEILYKYVEGPFMRTLVKALQHPEQDFLLIIEEINRANVAAVFGDVFQLLDRKNGVSEYPVAASEDIKRYLRENGIQDCNELKIPSNMYIWATMNSADQGVFPMDTAFKRRWEFEYIGVNDKKEEIEEFEIPMQEKKDVNGNPIKDADGNVTHEWMNWNKLRTQINDKLTTCGKNEDKLLGPFFISMEKLESVNGHNEKEAVNFVKSFKSKVLMYLFEDVCKMRPGDLFNCDKMRYSEICKKFDSDGIGVFNF